jgi:Sulfatase
LTDVVKKSGGLILPLNHILLIVFFVLNGMNGFRNAILFREPFLLFVMLIGLGTITHWLCRLLIKDKARAALISFLVLFILLYARTIHSGINEWYKPGRFNYAYYFPLLLLVSVSIVWLIRKTSWAKLEEFRKYLNIVLISLSLYEAGRLAYDLTLIHKLPEMEYSAEVKPRTWVGANKPNIYFLLFDEYQGEKGITKMTGRPDSSLRTYLTANHFMVAKDPSSGFRYTFYSMASLFGMSDLAFPRAEINHPNNNRSSAFLDEKRIIMASAMIREKNHVVDYLSANGYDIRNHSIFDLPGYPSQAPDITYLTWYGLQYHKTLPGWLVSDLMHIVPSNAVQRLFNTFFYRTFSQNEDCYSATLTEIKNKTGKPRFVYSHFLQPRPPVFLDATGKARNITAAMREFNRGGEPFIQSYINYLKYTDQMIRKMVDEISQHDPNAVVVIASDHGLRNWAGESDDVFNIQLAIKLPFPSTQFTDTSTLSNSFRIVLNQVAGQKLDLLPRKKQL